MQIGCANIVLGEAPMLPVGIPGRFQARLAAIASPLVLCVVWLALGSTLDANDSLVGSRLLQYMGLVVLSGLSFEKRPTPRKLMLPYARVQARVCKPGANGVGRAAVKLRHRWYPHSLFGQVG